MKKRRTLYKITACLAAAVLALSASPAMAAGIGEKSGGIDFDASNGVVSRLLYGTTFYIDWQPGNGLTNHENALPGRDCSGSAANGANPNMVLSLSLTFEAIDGVSDPTTCWNRVALRLRSSKVDGKEQASEFVNIPRSTYGNASRLDLAVPLSSFGVGNIDWTDLKELIIQVPLEEVYHLRDENGDKATGDSQQIRLTVSDARIVDQEGLAARGKLQELMERTENYRYAAGAAAASYEQIRQEAKSLLNGFGSAAAFEEMISRLNAAIGTLTALRDVTERAAELTGPTDPVAPQNGAVTLELAGEADLSLHDPDALCLVWEGDITESITGGQAVLHTSDGDITVSFDALQTREADGCIRFWLPLPGVDTLTSATIVLQTEGNVRLIDAYIGDTVQHTELTDELSALLEETPQLYTPSPALAEDYAAAAATARQMLEQGVFSNTANLREAEAALASARHTWRERSRGDMDNDVQITSADALMALQVATQKVIINDPSMADVNRSAEVTAEDALLILQYATRKISAFAGAASVPVQAPSVINAENTQERYRASDDTLSPDASSAGITGQGGYLAYYGLDFGNGDMTTFMAVLSVPEEAAGQALEIRLDHLGGECVGALTLESTGGTEAFDEQYAALTRSITGVHDVYLTAPVDVHLDCFVFSSYDGTETAEEKEARMEWWNEARFGMFIHWGAYANFPFDELGFTDWADSAWVQYNSQLSKEEYAHIVADTFDPQQWDAESIVQLAQDAGQKYIVFTSKHHEGFSMFDTKVTGFQDYSLLGYGIYDGPDPLLELSQASKAAGIPFGCYYSIQDWHHPSQEDLSRNMLDKTGYVADMKAQLRELIQVYDVDILWFDGEWQSWWNSDDGRDLYRYLRTMKPSLIINNRIGKRAEDDGDFGTPEQSIPIEGLGYDWESCITMNSSWGYAPYDTDWKTSAWIVQSAVNTASKGGNLLLNVGPDAQGLVPEECAENMRAAGEWFRQYGSSIFGTTASPFYDALPFGAATKKDGVLYLHVEQWPASGKLSLPALKNTVLSVNLMGADEDLAFSVQDYVMTITVPSDAPNSIDTVIEVHVDGMPQAAATYILSENYALNKPATVSNYYHNDSQYNGAAAVDGDSGTRWATDDPVRECWLEVDLGEEITFNSVVIQEYSSRVSQYQIEYWADGAWQVAGTGTTIGDRRSNLFEQVTARRVRLHILAVSGDKGPTIWEFGVYTMMAVTP